MFYELINLVIDVSLKEFRTTNSQCSIRKTDYNPQHSFIDLCGIIMDVVYYWLSVYRQMQATVTPENPGKLASILDGSKLHLS